MGLKKNINKSNGLNKTKVPVWNNSISVERITLKHDVIQQLFEYEMPLWLYRYGL